MKAILYVGHGTRSKKGVEEVKAFLNRVIERVDVPIQEVSFLELTEPLIDEGFQQCVEKGATEITVVPLFLLAAGHIKDDIPEALSVLHKRFPEISVTIQDPFGVKGEILDAIAELIRGTVGSISGQDSVLVVGRGSSDPAIRENFELIRGGIKERLLIDDVTVCFLAAAEPRLQEGFHHVMEKNEGAVIVVPYLLFSGLLIAEVTQEVRKWQTKGRTICHTGPLSIHRVIEDIVVEKASL